MKNLMLTLSIVLLSACNENKTSQTDRSESMSIDSTASDTMQPTVPGDSVSQMETDSAAVNDASKSGASSITPRKDSVRRR